MVDLPMSMAGDIRIWCSIGLARSQDRVQGLSSYHRITDSGWGGHKRTTPVGVPRTRVGVAMPPVWGAMTPIEVARTPVGVATVPRARTPAGVAGRLCPWGWQGLLLGWPLLHGACH